MGMWHLRQFLLQGENLKVKEDATEEGKWDMQVLLGLFSCEYPSTQ